jgi:single-strand DNA-binding protein
MVNRTILVGNLGKDAELKTFDNGSSVANFSLATSESYKDKSDEWQQKTEWHNIAVWGNQAQRAAKLTKGTTLYLEGKLSTRKWQDKNGNDRYTTEIVASYFRTINRSEKPNSSEPLPNPHQSGAEGPDNLPF